MVKYPFRVFFISLIRGHKRSEAPHIPIVYREEVGEKGVVLNVYHTRIPLKYVYLG